MAKVRPRSNPANATRDVLRPMRPGESPFDDLLYEKRGGVARITLNRPQVYNAYATGTLQELSRAVEDALAR